MLQRNIEMVVRIDSKYRDYIRTDSKVNLETEEHSSGNRFVNISRGFQGTPLQDNQEISGQGENGDEINCSHGAPTLAKHPERAFRSSRRPHRRRPSRKRLRPGKSSPMTRLTTKSSVSATNSVHHDPQASKPAREPSASSTRATSCTTKRIVPSATSIIFSTRCNKGRARSES